jgi:hypothetical protein
MGNLEQIQRMKDIEERIHSIHHSISMVNLPSFSLTAGDARERFENYLRVNGLAPKSEQAQAELARLKRGKEEAESKLDEARTKATALHDELKKLQAELGSQSIVFSPVDLEEANNRVRTLQERECRILNAIEKNGHAMSKEEIDGKSYSELRVEEADLLAEQAIGGGVQNELNSLYKRMDKFNKQSVLDRPLALTAKFVNAGLQRKLDEVRNDLVSAGDDVKALTRLFVMEEIRKENDTYSRIKSDLAGSFIRIMALAELLPRKEAESIIPAVGAYQFRIPSFRITGGKTASLTDFSYKDVDRNSAISAEMERLTKQGARF